MIKNIRWVCGTHLNFHCHSSSHCLLKNWNSVTFIRCFIFKTNLLPPLLKTDVSWYSSIIATYCGWMASLEVVKRNDQTDILPSNILFIWYVQYSIFFLFFFYLVRYPWFAFRSMNNLVLVFFTISNTSRKPTKHRINLFSNLFFSFLFFHSFARFFFLAVCYFLALEAINIPLLLSTS